jgi:hypothetical protein
MVSKSHQFHRASRLPPRETRIQRKYRLQRKQQAKDEIDSLMAENARQATQGPIQMHEGNSADFAEDYASHVGGYDGPSYWVDVETIFDEESNRSLAQIRSLYQQLKQNHKQNNWIDLFKSLFPAYTHLKRITNDWTLPDSLDDRSHEVCNCSNPNPVVRQVDLIDLLGQSCLFISFS